MFKIKCSHCGRVIETDSWIEFFNHIAPEIGLEWDEYEQCWKIRKE